jgi:peptide/nickel transport system substrate-binding protein
MRGLAKLALAAALSLVALPGLAQDFIAGIPRSETLILQGPEAQNADWFNLWVPGGGATNNGNQQLSADTLWFINPEGGPNPWTNALASAPPEYNDDFTEMTVRLKEGIYWSDGVEFTADDLVYTVQLQKDTPGMNWSAPFQVNVASVEALDRNTVLFKLNAPNSRFHTIFTVRWNAAWILPKHVFETVDDPIAFNFNPPVSLGPYVLHNYDKTGQWAVWRLREDWQRTSIGMELDKEPAVKYAVWRTAGNPDSRVIELLNHNLDVINEIAPEGMFTVARQAGDHTTQWLPGFPFAHPDPTLPAVLFNHMLEPFGDKDVRWALALAMDIRSVAMGAFRGAANLSPLAIPPTGSAPDEYFEPMQPWLIDFELDLGNGQTIKPYDPTIAEQIAALVRPQWGDSIPTDEAQLKRMFGFGWYKHEPEAAAALMEKAGFTRQGNAWMKPDGTPFTIKLMVEGDNVPTLARAGAIIAQQWTQFGIPTTVDVAGPTFNDRRATGDFQAYVHWTVETWGGHPDMSFFLESYHSNYIVPLGERQPARNLQRWQDPELDRIIEANRTVGFDDPQVIELGMEYLKFAVQEMPMIPLTAYNKFAPFDTTYWVGYPTIDNPYSASGPFWSNIRYMVVALEANPNAPK